jgi:rubrerythrin
MKEDGELIKALKYAIDFEIKGENIYEDLANEAEDEFVKNTFSGLAKDELVHIEVINKYIESIEKETEYDFEKELKKVTTSPKRLFGILPKKFKQKAALAANQLKPFDIGMELEQKSIDYYKEQGKKAKSEATKRLFEFLTKQEKFHLKALQEAKDFLGDPENFYVEFERWGFGG